MSKICKARRIIPASYVLRWELIRVGTIRHHGGFADVSNGEYPNFKFSVAVKRLKTNEGDSDRIFKVPLINIGRYHYSTFIDSSSGCAERSSVGNIYPTRTSYLCWEFPCPKTSVVSAFSLSGCPTAM